MLLICEVVLDRQTNELTGDPAFSPKCSKTVVLSPDVEPSEDLLSIRGQDHLQAKDQDSQQCEGQGARTGSGNKQIFAFKLVG